MERTVTGNDTADRMEPPERGAPDPDGELDFASLRKHRWRDGIMEPLEEDPTRFIARGGNGIRPSMSFAHTLRARPLARVHEEIFEQIAIERSDIAFGEFYELLAPKVYGLIFRILHTEDDALDVLQDTFADLWAKAPMLYKIHTNLAAWTMQLARNLAFNHFRTQDYKKRSVTDSYEPARHENLILDEQTPERELTMNEARAEIQHAIEKLNPNQRKSIELIFFAELTHRAAAEKLQIPYSRFNNIFYDSLTELEHKLFPYIQTRQAPIQQRRMKKEAEERKKEAVERKKEAVERKKEAREDAMHRAEVLRQFLLGAPFAG
jgi:RNA polymerase sigma-70 factor, ECF subfamily